MPASEFLQLAEGLGVFSLLVLVLMLAREGVVVCPSTGMLDLRGRPDGLRRLPSLKGEDESTGDTDLQQNINQNSNECSQLQLMRDYDDRPI